MTTDPANIIDEHIKQYSIIDKVMVSIGKVQSDLATRDDCLAAMDFAARLREIAKDLSAQVEANVIKWIKANGAIIDNGVKWYVGDEKKTVCTSVKDTLEAIMQASGGDFDAVVACLSTNAWKHGAASKLLPTDVYEKLFIQKVDDDLKEGKPDKLQKFDTKYIR